MEIDEFLRELKEQYNREFEIKNSLERKSSSLTTVSGIVIILLFGFGIFLLDKINTSDGFSFILLIEIFLLIIFILNLLSISFAIWASNIKLYRHTFLENIFYDNSEHIDDRKKHEESNTDTFQDIMIESYLACNVHNSDINEKALVKIKTAQIFFLLSLIVIPILMIMLFPFLLHFPSTVK